MKKILSLILVVSTLFLCGTNAFAESNDSVDMKTVFLQIRDKYALDYPDDIEMIDEITDLCLNDPDLTAGYESDSETAIAAFKQCLDSSLNQQHGIDTYTMLPNGIFRSDYTVPVITQSTEYYCGPATVIAALIGDGKLANTTANKSASNQAAVADDLTVSKLNGMPPVPTVVNYLNTYYSGTPYGYGLYTRFNYETSISYMTYAFANGMVPVVRVTDTSCFDYYNGESFSHYVAVQEINYTNETIVIVDPHYNSAYRGYHTITFDEFYNAMKAVKNNLNSYIISYGNRDH